jgi:hypothetical protein
MKTLQPADMRAEVLKDHTSIESRPFCPDPPVTEVLLRELDVPKIFFVPKVRHDVNFELNLQFGPVGEDRKVQKVTEFSNCLQTHLEAFIHDPVAFEKELSGRDWCLPLILWAIAEILCTLEPSKDQSLVEKVLDVECFIQQLKRREADLEKFASWLSRTLKLHCAPERDNWVDDVCKRLSQGNSTDVAMIVQGLQDVLCVLETMKLVGQTVLKASVILIY